MICGIDPETSCPKCRPAAQRMAARVAQSQRLKALEDRLARADIDLDDFADVVWMRLQPSLESEVRKIMLETVDMALRDLRIVGRIEGTWRR
jgi:hypothetical protein